MELTKEGQIVHCPIWIESQVKKGRSMNKLTQLPQPRKPSLRFLLLTYNIQPEALARQSGLPVLIAVALRSGYGTTEEVAQKALDALNVLKGTRYTLDDIEIELHKRHTAIYTGESILDFR
jgi:hypothetical protein